MLAGLDWTTWLGIAFLAVAALMTYASLTGVKITTGTTTPSTGTTTGTGTLLPTDPVAIAAKAAADDAADFAAVQRLDARFIRLKCQEGIDAVQTCLTHFFHKDSA